MKSDVKKLTRKLKLIEIYHDSENTDPSLVRHSSNYEVRTHNGWLQHISNQLEQSEPNRTSESHNVTEEERKAVLKLKSDKSIVIKKADKINVFVIIDAEYYKSKLVLRDHLKNIRNYHG